MTARRLNHHGITPTAATPCKLCHRQVTSCLSLSFFLEEKLNRWTSSLFWMKWVRREPGTSQAVPAPAVAGSRQSCLLLRWRWRQHHNLSLHVRRGIRDSEERPSPRPPRLGLLQQSRNEPSSKVHQYERFKTRLKSNFSLSRFLGRAWSRKFVCFRVRLCAYLFIHIIIYSNGDLGDRIGNARSIGCEPMFEIEFDRTGLWRRPSGPS